MDFSRKLGDTEHNWVRAVESGTGITVIGLVFSRPLNRSQLQHALDMVQASHPRLRSQLVWTNGCPSFQVSPNPFVKVELVESESIASVSTPEHHNIAPRDEQEEWIFLVENEMNTNIWKTCSSDSVPVQMFVVRMYILKGGRSLLVWRIHTAICDMASASVIVMELLNILVGIKKGQILLGDNDIGDSKEIPEQSLALEDIIPKNLLKKPFWAHGLDLLGYGLGSLRHALLPFEATGLPMRSRIIRSKLNVQQTENLLQACKREGTTLFGAMSAAGLKATTICKELGNRAESFAIMGLLDCRKVLDALSDSTVGFYHSAILNTHNADEFTGFWDLARRCSKSLETAIDNGKHFTDMGNLNFLMFQALQHPNLTPGSSLRTSLMVLFQDSIKNGTEEINEALGVEDHLGCASIHGIGPVLSVFHSIDNGALQCSNVYVTPLYSPAQMHKLVGKMMAMLTGYC